MPQRDELAAEPPPVQVRMPLDGGVPLDQFLYALAVARCQYFSRCFTLSTYVANDCVDQLVNNGSFNYPPRGATITYLDPSSALAQAATAGDVHYDPHQEAQCFAAQLAEGCAGSDLVVNLPACARVFTCPAGTDGGGGATDGGAADGGAPCSFYDSPVQTCSTDQDCADGTGASRAPYCVAGICETWRCGYFPVMGIDSCTSLAAAGEPCLTNAFSVLTNPAAPDAMCAPGLNCQGATRDGGLGVCVVPLDVGGACTDDNSCKLGLACACGICEIPPASGPCLNDLCQVGTAYCDRASNTCHPVRLSGASCAGANNSCAPGLVCDVVFSICGPPS